VGGARAASSLGSASVKQRFTAWPGQSGTHVARGHRACALGKETREASKELACVLLPRVSGSVSCFGASENEGEAGDLPTQPERPRASIPCTAALAPCLGRPSTRKRRKPPSSGCVALVFPLEHQPLPHFFLCPLPSTHPPLPLPLFLAHKTPPQLALLTRLNDEVLTRRSAGKEDAGSLVLAATLIEHNPEAYTAWNWRRECVGPVLRAGGAPAVAAAEAELALTEKALRRNPKSYAAWHARRWVVGHRLSSLAAEVRLVDALLDADARNFHAWAYRGWVADLAGVPAADQLAATTSRIEANFSNYSAWHARSALLVRVHGGGGSGDGGRGGGGVSVSGGGGAGDADGPPVATTTLHALLSSSSGPPSGPGGGPGGGGGQGVRDGATLPPGVLAKDYALVRAAAFTDPVDQAPWFYHRWLVAHTVAAARAAVGAGGRRGGGGGGGGGDGRAPAPSTPAAQAAVADADATLAAEVEACEALLAAEPDRSQCKWPLLALAHLAEARAEVAGLLAGEVEEGADSGGRGTRTPPPAAVALYEELAELDPLRAGFYRDAAAGVAAGVVPEL